MAYTKKTWVTERIFSPDLQNIEDGLDQIHDLDVTKTGIMTFLSDPVVSKIDAGIRLDDIDAGGVEYSIRSLDGKIQIFDEDAVTEKIADIIAHGHGGGVDGVQVSHTDLLDIVPGSHHAQDHVTRHAVGAADPLAVGVPSNIGTANVEGSLTDFVRRDHVHAHPSGLGTGLHHTENHAARHLQAGGDALSIGAPIDVALLNATGVATNYAARDHAHRGLFLEGSATAGSGVQVVSVTGISSSIRRFLVIFSARHASISSPFFFDFNAGGSTYNSRRITNAAEPGTTRTAATDWQLIDSLAPNDHIMGTLFITRVGGTNRPLATFNVANEVADIPNITTGAGFRADGTAISTMRLTATQNWTEARLEVYGLP